MSLLLLLRDSQTSAPVIGEVAWATTGTIMVSQKAITVIHMIQVQTDGMRARERHAFAKGVVVPANPSWGAWSPWAAMRVAA